MRNQVISQQQLWRPAEEVLHFLTECRPELSPAPYKEGSIAPTTTVVSNANKVKRQAPAVWRPPVAMKPQIPGPPSQPKEEPNPDSTYSSCLGDDKDSARAMVNNDAALPSREPITAAGSSVENTRDWHNFFGGESNAHLANSDFGGTQLMPPPRAPTEDHNAGAQVLESNKLFPRQDVQLSSSTMFPNNPFIENSSMEFSSSHFQVNANALASASSSIVASSSAQDNRGADLLKQRIGIVSPFIKQQVAQTPLFSGLGTVSFGSGSFSQPPAGSSIFAQSPGFGSQGGTVKEKEQQHSTTSAMSFGSGSFSVQPPAGSSIFAQTPTFGAQRIGSTAGEQQQQAVNLRLGSTTSASERGSCDSPAGNPVTDAGGLKPKELPGKRMARNPGCPAPAGKLPSVAATATDAATGTGPRKLRTRPLDLLMNAIKVAAPKPNNVADPQGKEAASPAPPPAAQQQAATHHRAYFVHTGAWIVQKKSTRHAKNAFEGRIEVNASSGAKGSSKKRSLTAISQEKKPDKQGKNQLIPDSKKKKKVEKPEKSQALSYDPKKKIEKKIDKQKKKIDKQKKKIDKQVMGGTTKKKTGKQGTPLEAEQLLPVDKDAPLIRSKRGRSQALPSRLRDSVINKVKKKTRKA